MYPQFEIIPERNFRPIAPTARRTPLDGGYTLQHSNKPKNELDLASALVLDMSKAESIEVLEGYWKRYLTHLERTWNKAEAHFSRSPKWSGWHGKYVKLRKQDQLLRYLVQARNTDEHSIDEITEAKRGFTGINGAGPGGRLYLEGISCDKFGRVTLRTPDPFVVTVVPSKVHLLPIKNRGVTYPPPAEHLGLQIDANNLISMARMGVDFYSEFLSAADSFFVTSSSSP